MKIALVTLLLFFSVKCYSQNWQTISNTDSTYFLVSASGADSAWNGYLRAIWADSVIINGNEETFYFYPTCRWDENNQLDTFKAATWLGKIMIRDAQGVELFFNQYLDSIFIHTQAVLNSSWLFSTDTNGITYVATVTSIDTAIIDGQIDSVKTISVQAFQGVVPVASTYNSLPIIISKNRGFYEVFEFYGFPYHQTASVSYYYLPLVHKRLDSVYKYENINKIDPAFKYKPGNEWVKFYKNYYSNGIEILTHDSIISHSILNASQVRVSYLQHIYYRDNDTSYHSFSTKNDTVTYSFSPSSISKLLPEHVTTNMVHTQGNKSLLFFIDFECGNRLKLNSFYHFSFGGQWMDVRGIGLTGFASLYYYYDDFDINSSKYMNQIFYYKLDSCSEGVFIPLTTKDIERNTQERISIYPNPVSDDIFIKKEDEIEITSYAVIDFTGKIYRIKKFINPVQTNDLQPGIYMLKLNTDKGVFYKKFIKE